MRACEPSRPVCGRFPGAIAALARLRAAPSAVAAATGTLTRTFGGNPARTIARGGESRMQVSIGDSAGHSSIPGITTSPAGRRSRCNIRNGRICRLQSTRPARSAKAASSNLAGLPGQRSRQGIQGPE